MKTTTPLFVLSLVLLLVGCQPSTHLTGLAPVSGTLTLDGIPLENAVVTLHPEPGQQESIRAASAVTGSQGKFAVMTLNPKDGAFPGKFRITVQKTEVVDRRTPEQISRDESTERGPELAAIPKSPKIETVQIVPARYMDPEITELRAEIVDGKNNLELKLTKDPTE